MTTGLNFWDSQVWVFMMELSMLLGAMLFANMLRRLIPLLRRSLIPSSVLAGFMVLIVNGLIEKFTGESFFERITLETLTYHGLGLGFVALALKTGDRNKSKTGKVDVFNTGVTVVATYLVQAIVGLAISMLLAVLIGSWACGGLLVPMGYGQGPGQAYNWGHIYETATDYIPFPNGTSFGLGVAAMGFVSASIGGIIYLNIIKAKGRKIGVVDTSEETENLSVQSVTAKGEIPLAESLDKLTVQFGLVFFTYMAAYGLMWLVSLGLDGLGGFFVGTVKPLIWGFNFLIGTLCAIIIKAVFRFWKAQGWMHREYCNDFMLSRIAGVMFDIMVTASIAAIDLSAFSHREFVIPLILVCFGGAVSTYFFVDKIAASLFSGYRDEAFLSLYGMLTGTASTGVILLREVDPFFETPASNNMIYQQLWAIVFGFPMLLLLGIAPQSPTMTWITMGALILLLVIMCLILFRTRIFRKKAK
ncbi:MAG: hypothetical protein IJB30_08150 [Clostridia bacterium]|nr:hypothetical protein [Clostridia bacterium]